MKKLSNTEAELKKRCFLKKRVQFDASPIIGINKKIFIDMILIFSVIFLNKKIETINDKILCGL